MTLSEEFKDAVDFQDKKLRAAFLKIFIQFLLRSLQTDVGIKAKREYLRYVWYRIQFAWKHVLG